MKDELVNPSILLHAANDVQTIWPTVKPKLTLILGSGWGEVVKAFNIIDEIPFEKITGLGKVGVAGHASKLVLAEMNGKQILIFQGRRHWYEGNGWTPIAIPVYISKHLGVDKLFLTNAAGGMSYGPGTLMLISDHINNMFSSPLFGPQSDLLGPRFPDQTEVYSNELRDKVKKTAKKLNIPLSEGVYIAYPGPNYETPAEIRAYKILGADAVGMSTASEAIYANSMGMKIAAMSCLSNYASGMSPNKLSHKEVIECMDKLMPTMKQLIPNIVEEFIK